MDTSDLYYKLSGKFSPAALLTVMFGGGLALAILGAVYGIIVLYMPIVYVNFLGTLGMGFAGGMVALWLGRSLRIRHVAVYLIGAGVVGLAGLYGAWVGWIWAVSKWDLLLFSPVAMAEVISEIARTGVWTLGKNKEPVSGIFLVLIWLVEAGVIVIMPIFVAMSIRDDAYCETTAEWLNKAETYGPFAPIADADQLRNDLEQGNFAVLEELAPLTGDIGDGSVFTQLRLRHAGVPESLHLLAVVAVTLKVTSQGKVSTTDQPIVRNMIIDRATHDLIVELAKSVEAEMAQLEAAEADAPVDAPDEGTRG